MKGDGYMGKRMCKNTNGDNRSYKFRLYPTDRQSVLFCKTIGCARFIYNRLLSDRTKFYQAEKKTLKREVTYYKNQKEFSFLKEVDSLALSNAKLNLDRAFVNFFEKKSKYPKFNKIVEYQNENKVTHIGKSIYNTVAEQVA